MPFPIPFFRRESTREQKITEIRVDDPLLSWKFVKLLKSRASLKLTLHGDVFFVYASPKSRRVFYERRLGLR